MSKTYFVNKYNDMFLELFSKKTDWEKVENIKDISGEIDFCYNVDNNDIESKLKLISKENFTKYNSIEVNKSYITYDKIVNIYILLISEKHVYIYKEGKVNTDKVRYYSEQNYFNYTFEQIKYDVSNKINPFLEENKLPSNGFNIIGMKYGIDEDYKVNLLEIDIDLDLSIEIDKLHKMKLHYWLFFDILNKFVFKNNLHHRWEKCEKNIKILNNNNLKINEPKTYLVNTSRILKDVLNNNGYLEGNIEKYCDFSSWDSYNTKNVESKIKIIPRNIINYIDNKRLMYNVIKKNNLEMFVPKTYIDLKNIDKSIFSNDKIFFIKESGSSGGRSVTVINSYQELVEIISLKKGDYILQEEVDNMLLIDGYKNTLRCYVLITDKKEIFLHKDILGIQHIKKYSKELDKNIHISHENPKYFNFKNIDTTGKVFDKIKDICFLILKCFIQDKVINNQYIILGIDIIIDNNSNPYLIEMNAFPNMQYCDKLVEYVIKKNMFTDFVNLYVNPKILGHEPKYGDWILCNPLFEDTHYQFKFKEVYEENLYLNIKDYDYKSNHSKLVSLNYWTRENYDLNNETILRYMNKKFILKSDCKKQLYLFMKENNILELSPISYLHTKEILDSTLNKKFYIKDDTGCAQKGVYKGDLKYIKNKEKEFLDKRINYIIQEDVENCIYYDNYQVVFSVFFYLDINGYFLHDKICLAFGSLIDNKVNKVLHDWEHGKHFEDISNNEIIYKNIIEVCNIFLKKYTEHMKTNYNIKNNEIGYGRFDILVTRDYEAKIIEINSSGAGNQHHKVSKLFFQEILHRKLNNKLYNI
tara:strand:+ start:131 stop:2566 length:2436 start_codon:yes stop_codon:yes gene_type:complete